VAKDDEMAERVRRGGVSWVLKQRKAVSLRLQGGAETCIRKRAEGKERKAVGF
jgi:hypothetical protein